jgi:hypothetical protein
VVEACNPKATAEALAAILLDGNMRAAMGRVMQRRIPNLYHKDRVRRLYENLYTGLMTESRIGAIDTADSKVATRPSKKMRRNWWPGRHRPEYA